jgi:hypothetical protein
MYHETIHFCSIKNEMFELCLQENHYFKTSILMTSSDIINEEINDKRWVISSFITPFLLVLFTLLTAPF